jgi:hypothetical protein
MPSEHKRLLELALESLMNKRKELDAEIEQISRQLRGTRGRKAVSAKPQSRKKPRFSKEERLRRAKRMKAYWENWRKQKKAGK